MSAGTEWINMLPEVGAPILQQQEEICRTIDEVAVLEQRAARLKLNALGAYLDLKDRIRKRWSVEDVRRARMLA